eukprot:scaffold2752_cov393-Prasinococcus_capsulatus_cf.AAC.16
MPRPTIEKLVDALDRERVDADTNVIVQNDKCSLRFGDMAYFYPGTASQNAEKFYLIGTGTFGAYVGRVKMATLSKVSKDSSVRPRGTATACAVKYEKL